MRDSDFDTKILVEQNVDDDTIRMINAGAEKLKIHSKGIAYVSDLDNIYLGNDGHEVGFYNLVIGNRAAEKFQQTSPNVVVGNNAFRELKSGSFNTVLGYQAGDSLSTGSNNVLLGTKALKAQAGSSNVSIGYESGNLEENNGSNNVFIGKSAGASFTGNSNGNIVIGADAGQFFLPNEDNVIIGRNARSTMSGCNNCVLIGANTGFPNSYLNNRLAIDSEATSFPLIYGNFSEDKIGLNGKVAIGENNGNSDLHLFHENDSDSDGFTIENESKANYWRLYTRSANGSLRFYSKEGEGNSCGNNGGTNK